MAVVTTENHVQSLAALPARGFLLEAAPCRRHIQGMKHAAIIAALLCAGQAAAEVQVSNCAFDTNFVGVAVDCEFTNLGPQAIRSVRHSVTVSEEGRQFPWLQEDRTGVNFRGGLEPGETVRRVVALMEPDPRMVMDNLRVTIEIKEAE